MIMSDNTAILAGFTREVMATGGDYEMHLFVKPDTDFGERFLAYDADYCEWIRVNGWLFAVEDIDTEWSCANCGETAMDGSDRCVTCGCIIET
jgi:hypothetical protein